MNQNFLVASVGGTKAPVVSSLQSWAPQRVCFLGSESTRKVADEALADYNKSAATPLSSGACDFVVIQDEQSLTSAIESSRSVTKSVREWSARGDQYKVVTDITGGTKCMSAGLALVARRWPSEFSYVGGSTRSKDGVGLVESGSELIIRCENPWEVLGFQVVEDAVTIFNQGGYAAAAAQIEAAMKLLKAGSVKRTLSALHHTISAYAAWDRFDHAKATASFVTAMNAKNDLAAVFAEPGKLIRLMENHKEQCCRLNESTGLNWLIVDDLIANASRRAQEQRFDDAAARLYRACEMIAQVQLREVWKLENTGKIPLERLPIDLQKKLASHAENDCVKVGLQDAFRLLAHLGDALGDRFIKYNLVGPTSPLQVRNNSILAHGISPISKHGYDQLSKACRDLRESPDANATTWSLPEVC